MKNNGQIEMDQTDLGTGDVLLDPKTLKTIVWCS